MLSTLLAISGQQNGLIKLFVEVRPYLIGAVVLTMLLRLTMAGLLSRWNRRDHWSPMQASLYWGLMLCCLIFFVGSYTKY